MATRKDNPLKAKISPEFNARLLRLRPEQKVRAIVMLRTKGIELPPGRRQSRVYRGAVVEAIRKSVESALIDIDEILKLFDGKRLATNVDALGSIPVETTPAGITALAACDHVKAVLEDQVISPLPRPRR